MRNEGQSHNTKATKIEGNQLLPSEWFLLDNDEANNFIIYYFKTHSYKFVENII